MIESGESELPSGKGDSVERFKHVFLRDGGAANLNKEVASTSLSAPG